MKVTALALAILLASPHADACDDFAIIAKPLGYALGAGLVAGYAGGIGYFGWHDLANDRADHDYLAGDLAFNGVFAAVWGAGFVDAVRHDSGAAVPLGALTALHAAMLVHAVDHIDFDFHNFDSTAATWTLGSVYGLQALAFVAQGDGPHERAFGIAEISINAPLAAGAAYLAYRSAHDSSDGHTLMFGGVAVLSTALTIQGAIALVHPHRTAGLDFLPTASGDSVGLSASGAF